MRKTIYVLAVVSGLIAALGGLILGLVLGLLTATAPVRATNGLQQATVALAIAAIGIGCGVSLAWAGAQALREAPDRPFRLPAWGWWLLATLLVLILGQLAFDHPDRLQWTLPVFHVLAGALGAFLFLSLAVGAARSRGGTVPARPAIGGLAWGALGASALGIFLELFLLLLAGLLAAAWLATTQPGLWQEVQDWAMSQMRNPGQPPDLSTLSGVASLPLAILAILAGVSVAGPVIEETAKGLAVPLATLTGRRLSRLDGFLIGVSAGAGFTLVEGIFNGSLILADPSNWGFAMLVRGGTAALHCLAAGLDGLAWQAVLTERRFARGLGLALAALALHGTWNAGAGLSALIGLTGGAGQPAVVLLQIVAAACMALVWLAVVAGLPLLAARVARQSAGPSGQRSLQAMASGYDAPAEPAPWPDPLPATELAPPLDDTPSNTLVSAEQEDSQTS